MKIDKEKYINYLANQVYRIKPQLLLCTREWATSFPKIPAVYIIRYKKIIVYAGETGNLRGRMKDFCNTKNHTLRRSVGAEQFAEHPGYYKATSKDSYCEEIELLLNSYLSKNLTIACLPVDLGRKELEEYIIREQEPRYNKKGQRKTC